MPRLHRIRPLGTLRLAPMLATCGDISRSGLAPKEWVRPRYGDFVIPLDSITVPARVRSGDTVFVELHPRAPYSVCTPWVLITHHAWGARLTLYGVHGPDRSECQPPVAWFVLGAWDSADVQPISALQPDSSMITRYLIVEPLPLPVAPPQPPGSTVRDSVTPTPERPPQKPPAAPPRRVTGKAASGARAP